MNIGVIFLIAFVTLAFILFFTEGSIYFRIEKIIIKCFKQKNNKRKKKSNKINIKNK